MSMERKQSEYVRLLHTRYGGNISNDERDDLYGLTVAPEEEGLEAEMLVFLQQNPNASLQDVMQFWGSIVDYDPLEIVDDDELDEDDD